MTPSSVSGADAEQETWQNCRTEQFILHGQVYAISAVLGSADSELGVVDWRRSMDSRSDRSVDEELIEKLTRGEPADFSERKERVLVQAQVLRSLLIGSLPAAPRGHNLFRGIRLTGAVISGSFDLEDLSGPQDSALAPIILRSCTLSHPINIHNAHLSRLELSDCRLVQIDGKNCRVDGSVVLERIVSSESGDQKTGASGLDNWYGDRGPRPGEAGQDDAPAPSASTSPSSTSRFIVSARAQGRCCVDLGGTTIGGDVVVRQSLLVAKPERPEFVAGEMSAHYALNLGRSQIHGDVSFDQGSAALGGGSLSGARITGNLWFSGAKLVGTERHALDCQLAVVDGFVGLRATHAPPAVPLRFESEGLINLLQTRIRGALDLSGAKLLASKSDLTLQAHQSEIGLAIFIRGSNFCFPF